MARLALALLLAAAFAATLFASRPPASAILYGDVDCDNVANSIDAVLVLQLETALVTELPCQFRGDVNGDKLINALDATLILQYNAGLIDRLGPSPTGNDTITQTPEP